MSTTLTRRSATAVGLATVMALSACGKSAESGSDADASASTTAPAAAETVLTPAPTAEADSAIWAVYRETEILDPLYAFDYPDNAPMAIACESLLRQNPDLTIGPGVASSVEYTQPTSLVITLRDDVTFWDGTPMTVADVIFSLERQRNPELGGFYGQVFVNVTDIAETGDSEITITTTQQDMLLLGELSGPVGVVTKAEFVENAGADYGTAAGGIMCTGPFQFDSWNIGEGVTFTRYDDYWDTSLPRMLKSITFKGVPDEAVLTSGLLTGEIDGVYPLSLSTLDQLRESDAVTVSEGAGYGISAFVISDFSGTLADKRVRQALSMALDRQGLISALYKGAAEPARSLAVPGTWGYAKDTFAEAWDALPDVSTVDVETATALVDEAGATGQTLRIGMSSEIASLAISAGELQRAAESIGLEVELVSVSAANYINFFIDEGARESVDGFFTVNYPDFADPLAILSTLIGPDGSQAYNGFADPAAIDLMQRAQTTADDEERAALVIELQTISVDEMLWIPIVAPSNVLVMSNDLTGAPATFQYMFGPWAAYLGAP